MPYEAAKAVAATFCWEIRHVLTPLFGPDFPSICVPTVNGKARDFPHIKLDNSIILRAAHTARAYRNLEPDRGFPSTITRNPTPASGHEDSFADRMPYRQIHPKVPRRSYADSVGSARDSSSEPSYCHSPQSTVTNSFTPVNVPRTAENIPRSSVPSPEGPASPQNQRTLPMHTATGRLGDIGLQMNNLTREWHRAEPTGNTTIYVMSGDEESSLTSPISSDGSDSDDEEDDEDYQDPVSRRVAKLKKGKGRGISGRSFRDKYDDRKGLETGSFAHEVTAAHALLNLHMEKLAKPDSDDESEARNESPWGPPIEVFKGRNDKKRRISV